MAIDFIFVISVLALVFLAFSFIYKDGIIAQISCWLMMTLGVSILISGVAGIDNLMTLAYGTIFVCVGFYISMKISIEYLEANI